MNLSDFSTYPTNLSNYDVELQDFYGKVLDEILKNGKMVKTFSDILFKRSALHPNQVSFPSTLHRTAYLFRYGPCYSSALTHHLLELLKNSVPMLDKAVDKGSINVCCLGSGPGSEVVAISKVFNLLQQWLWPMTKKMLCIDITYVDGNYQWKSILDSVMHALKMTESICDVSKLEINVHFVKADFSKSLNSATKKVLEDADLIMMTKFLSNAKAVIPKEEVDHLIEYIAENMKINSILFYLDTGITQQWKFLNYKLTRFANVQCLYLPVQFQPYYMTIESVRKCVTLFWEKFRGNILQAACIVNACAWGKSDNFECETFLTGRTRRKTLEDLQKSTEGKAESTKAVLKDYYRKVRGIIPKKRVNQRTDFNFSCVDDLEQELFLTKPKSKRSTDGTEFSLYD